MKRILLIALVLLLTLALPVLGLAEESRTITVKGTATVSVPADIAVISIGVETSGAVVSEASAENADRVEAVLQALLASGIAREDIATQHYYVNTLYDYSSYDAEGSPRIRGYQVSNTLSVTVRDIEAVGNVIDTALSAGANTCNGISFQSSQAGSANDDALIAAIAEGRRKAELAATASGLALGDLLSLTEGGGSYSGVLYAKAESSADMGASTRIIADGLDYTATVTLTFAVK